MTFAQRERERLAELLIEVGPDAPTLNDGWQTRDLAVHLFIRERRPLAAVGIFVPVAKPLLQKETEKQLARPYEDVVQEWAAGPPKVMKPVDAKMNTAEHFIHHEDVRRGGGEVNPREFSAAVNKQLLAWAKRFGQMSFRKAEVPVVLTPPNLPPVTLGGKAGVVEQGNNVARVQGEPGELLLWVSGRSLADVTLTGNTSELEEIERGV